MYALAETPDLASEPAQWSATVTAVDGDTLTILGKNGPATVTRAVSCSIDPRPGDRVLVADLQNDDRFVIAILERPKSTALKMTLPGDLTIATPSGRLCLAAQEGVDVVSARDIALTSSDFSLRAKNGEIFLDRISLLAKDVLAEVEKVKNFIGLFDSVVERITQKVKRSYRRVEEIDIVRSEQIDYRSAKNMSLRGRNTLFTAEELVKIDGDQIHLG